MRAVRLKAALGKALDTMEQLADRVTAPALRAELQKKADATRAKINALSAEAGA
jgi:hypothetical protein